MVRRRDNMPESKRKTHTSTAVKARYNKKTYKNYNLNFRIDDDSDIIAAIENEKASGASTTEAFRRLLRKVLQFNSLEVLLVANKSQQSKD